ncbi:MAG: TIGR04211 family SH3 domain-containing protein [Gammaproteobacteria bacterium]|nr:TIGR04211 family SH3 domain-containing protein [Gammaproteobacteria bacterium]|tara:strand:+ start:16374 stop:17033 length:660 start_codon:yes stop_codon:yes gene_type:complete
MKIVKTFIIILTLWVSAVSAESFVFITDTVDLPMRSQSKIANNPSNIIRMLPSGTKLEFLSTTETGWTQVKFENDTGWIISRYLTNKEPAMVQLKKLKRTHTANKLLITKQKLTNKKMQEEIKELKVSNTKLSIQSSKSQAEKEHIEQVYKDALKIEHLNEKLNSEIMQLKTEIQLLRNNDTAAKEASSRNWFIVGAIILFIGILIGVIFPKLTNQRRI